jgi:hypothetical protein
VAAELVVQRRGGGTGERRPHRAQPYCRHMLRSA